MTNLLPMTNHLTLLRHLIIARYSYFELTYLISTSNNQKEKNTNLLIFFELRCGFNSSVNSFHLK